MIPETISYYKIVNKLGAGGMGEVYLAVDTRLGRKAALKLLPLELTSDEDRVRRFHQEARTVSALNHPNILTIYDIGQVDSLHFIATEFINGVTLRKRMHSTRMSLLEILDVAIQVASALAAAHQAGIVHRDIKPENLMLRPDGYVKVLDFGLAKLIEREIATTDTSVAIASLINTEPGLVMGTPRYMSPEQVRGLDVDGRTDIFSLGVVLYEMITGKAPFDGLTISDVIVAILQNDPLPISQYSRQSPAKLQQVISKALHKQTEERYQRVELLLSDMKDLSQMILRRIELDPLPQSELNAGTTIPIGSKQPPIQAPEAAFSSTIIEQGLRAKGANQPIDSLAILPLVNASTDSSTEYLSDGITESIINNLSQLPKLRVMARSTVFRYKGSLVDPQQAGRDLNVNAVVMGRVLLLSNRLIIRTELVDVADGAQLWGEQYNRELSDIFAIEEEISKEISDKLRLRLTGEERERLAKRYTENSEAYQLYLKGRFFWNRFNNQTLNINDLNSAEELFKKSIEVDVNFALAHSSLGVCHLSHVLKGLGGVEYYAKAKDAFDHALTIDPELIEPRVRLIYIDLFKGRAELARQNVNRLMRDSPNEPSVYVVAAYVYRLSGQYDLTLEAWDQLLKISPTDIVFASYNRARIYIYQRDYTKAAAEIATGQAFEPHHPLLRFYGAVIDYYRADFDKATHTIEAVLAEHPEVHARKIFLTFCYMAKGDRDRALDLIDDRVMQTARADQDMAYQLATLYALDRQNEKAIEWLERAIAMGNENYPWFIANPNWETMRDDLRYKSILENLGHKWGKLSGIKTI